MNVIRTAMLLALMTALFMGVGYLIGGSGGMMIAFLLAAGMNLFSYWNADKMVLRMHHATEVDERTAPQYYGIVRDLGKGDLSETDSMSIKGYRYDVHAVRIEKPASIAIRPSTTSTNSSEVA